LESYIWRLTLRVFIWWRVFILFFQKIINNLCVSLFLVYFSREKKNCVRRWQRK
jgi:hypothetical protein